jgi:hypothetical protein
VAWWRAAGNAIDSADSHHGTLQGGTTFAPGKVGQAFSFDGNGDYVETTNDLNFSSATSFSIAAWIKPSSFSGFQGIVTKVGAAVRYYSLETSATKVAFSLQTDGQSSFVQSSVTISDGDWHHVVGVRDRATGTARIYVDGVERGSATDPTGDLDFDVPTRIGDNLAGFQTYFYGLIDEVEIFNRALCDAEIKAIFDAGSAGKCEGGEVVQCIDHFLCYKAKLTGGDICSSDAPSNAGGSCEVEENCGGTEDETSFCVPNKFPKGVQVSLADQFEEGTFDVKKPVSLCTPADKNEEGIIDEETHLEGYQILPATKHVPQTNIKIENQFHPSRGELFVNTIKPDRLLVPTAKSLTGPVDAPDPASHNVDHYKCYKAKVTPGTPTFPKGLQATVVDQFNQPKLYDLKKPTRLCNPVDKNGEGIKNEATHLMCYQAKPATGQPKHAKVLGIHVNNQFGPEQLDTIKEEELCVPSEKILP